MNIRDISIIAVDDEAVITRVLGKSFEGCKSFASFSAAAGFLADAKLENCDIVFMDINIPGGQDGISLTRHVKRVAPQCDVVVMTGEATFDNALAAMKAGAYDFLKKPFTYDYLEAIVDRCVEKRSISAELKLIKAAQEELSAAYSQLISSERIKEAFLSMIGHELRTPLTKILAGAELLRDGAAGHQDALLTAIETGAAEMHEVIESLIFYSDLRKEPAPRNCSCVDLKEAARSVLEELSVKAAEAGVSLSLRCSGAGVLVNGEPSWLRNAIKRLVLNAIVYNQKGGSAEIFIEDGLAAASVTVSDSGIGIPEELVSRPGSSFYQIADYMTRKTGGLGLGLAIVKQVVEAHNGTVSVKSLPGQGTAFTVTFKKEGPVLRAALPGGLPGEN